MRPRRRGDEPTIAAGSDPAAYTAGNAAHAASARRAALPDAGEPAGRADNTGYRPADGVNLSVANAEIPIRNSFGQAELKGADGEP